MNDQRITPWGGQELITGTTELTDKKYFCIIIRESTTISKLTDETQDVTFNILADSKITVSDALKAGVDIIFAPKGKLITNIKLESGSAWGYKEGLL